MEVDRCYDVMIVIKSEEDQITATESENLNRFVIIVQLLIGLLFIFFHRFIVHLSLKARVVKVICPDIMSAFLKP